MSQPDFSELLSRVRAGDQDAATELVRRYEPAIRRAVRFRLGAAGLSRLLESMDICQSVLASFFLRAAAGQYELDSPEQLLKLLVAIARNKLVMQSRAQYRQRRDQRRIDPGGLQEGQAISAEPSPSQYVAGRELLLAAERLMSAEERQLVEWRKEGMTWDAIAAQVGGTPEALRKKLARAADGVAHRLHLDDYCHE
jgi:RNA polymerase sigma factor (sigma-70 family)